MRVNTVDLLTQMPSGILLHMLALNKNSIIFLPQYHQQAVRLL